MMRKISFLSIVFFIGFLSVRADGPPTDPVLIVPLKVGPATLKTEVALTDAQKEIGLMHRPHLDDNAGMLFIFDHEQRVAFWMKNTTIPLSIAFIGRDGVISQIADMQPLDQRIIQSESSAVIYALEVNQKWFDLNHVKVGDVVAPVDRSWKDLTASTRP
jgi:uncharacterized protein